MSTIFEVNLAYDTSLNFTVICNCSNELQLCANLTRYISLEKLLVKTVVKEKLHRLSLIQRYSIQ